MKYYQVLSLILLFGFGAYIVSADNHQATEFEAVPEPPELPSPVESGETLEPEITIIEREDGIIEEYRVNGQLYKVKVTPSVGPVYYLIDRNGDGNMERLSNIYDENAISVPQWILLEW